MKYQKIVNFFRNAANQPPKFMAKAWFELNGDSFSPYNTNS